MRAIARTTLTATVALGFLQGPALAHADEPDPTSVRLEVTVGKPRSRDGSDLGYPVRVVNHGPALATGLTLRHIAWQCPKPGGPLSECTVIYESPVELPDLPAGAQDEFTVVVVPPPGPKGRVIRTSIEVLFVNQQDSASVPGDCVGNDNGQADCEVIVTSPSA